MIKAVCYQQQSLAHGTLQMSVSHKAGWKRYKTKVCIIDCGTQRKMTFVVPMCVCMRTHYYTYSNHTCVCACVCVCVCVCIVLNKNTLPTVTLLCNGTILFVFESIFSWHCQQAGVFLCLLVAKSYRSTYKSHSESSLTTLTLNSIHYSPLQPIKQSSTLVLWVMHLAEKSTTGLHTYKYKHTYIMHPINNVRSANVLFTLKLWRLAMHDLCTRCLHYGSQKHLNFRT